MTGKVAVSFAVRREGLSRCECSVGRLEISGHPGSPVIRKHLISGCGANQQDRSERPPVATGHSTELFVGVKLRMADQKATNVTWHAHNITREDRQKLNGHRGAVLWFTGLSGCGKSTIANAVDQLLHERGAHTFVLDGDNIRMGLSRNLGFTPEDRTENIRRIGEVARLFSDSATIISSAFISPSRADRDLVRALLPEGDFIEIMVQASLETCESRDPKGLYKKARAGEIENFTGISAPYEAPENPELVLDSDHKGVEELARQVIAYLISKGILPE